ncbi:hypothetical protein GGI25_002872 [Coemansia spiralis]|uniref:Uncharacterized protein n=1 Tax=Coemansia spiralis TaxID=417178 RepID=A0A9W8KX11_9FUNG|nr:hypothetical protein GGI25_002872 [Coemansia spiralis]
MAVDGNDYSQDILVPDIDEPREYKLTPLDGSSAGRSNCQFVFFYALPRKRHAEVSKQLQISFYQTMRHYPIFYGRLDETENELASRFEKEYARTEGLPYWIAWLKELLSIPCVYAGIAPFVKFVVTWCVDGLGILFSIDHLVADGVSIDILMNQWAATARGQPLRPIDYDHDGRDLAGLRDYVGNAVCPVHMSISLEELKRSLADVGRFIAPQWLAFSHKMLDSEWFAKFLAMFANPMASQLTVSNISRLGFYQADFGFGPLVHMTQYPVLAPGFSVLHPLSPGGSIHILWNIAKDVFERLKADSLFCRCVDIIF